MPTTNTLIFDAAGQPQTLGTEIGRGGEGSVYSLAARKDVLVKCYHPEKLKGCRTERQRKIEAMRRCRPARTAGISWPLLSVFDQEHQWIGYAMYRASGHAMQRVAHPLLSQKYFPGLDRRRLVGYLLNLISQVQALHQQGICVGDYNLNNVLCVPDSEEIWLIDCDSYQIQAEGTRFPCPVGSPDLTPAEHHGKAFSEIVRNEQSEAFSLAIMLFKCLMLGRHPYDIVGGTDPVTNLQKGEFPYGLGNKGIPKGPWYNIWSHMPHRIKSLFIQTFTEGARDPSRRVTLAEWHQALSLYKREMDKGWHETAIRPATPKAKEYRGQRSMDGR